MATRVLKEIKRVFEITERNILKVVGYFELLKAGRFFVKKYECWL